MLGVLPGIREIRSALAGGYLWIVVLWLILNPAISHSRLGAEPYKSAHELGNDIGPIALGVGVTFLAYLIGTFMNELRGLVASLYLRVRQSATTSQSVFEREQAIERLAVENREFRQRLLRLVRLPPGLRRLEGGSAIRYGELQNSVERLAFRLQVFVRGYLRNLLRAFLAFPAAIMSLTVVLMDRLDSLTMYLVRPLLAIRLEPYSPFLTTEGVATVERYLDDPGHSPRGGRKPGVAEVIQDFPIVRIRLLRTYPDTVSEYDRLMGEADFRSAIFLPLVGIVGVLSVKVSAFWLIALLALLTLLQSARTKRREAGDILADSLEIATPPCVQP